MVASVSTFVTEYGAWYVLCRLDHENKGRNQKRYRVWFWNSGNSAAVGQAAVYTDSVTRREFREHFLCDCSRSGVILGVG